jgi:hypothetical protein
MKCIECLLEDNKLPRFPSGKGQRLFSLLPSYAWVITDGNAKAVHEHPIGLVRLEP